MKTVCAVGHFGFGKELLNGQTIKTKIVTAELEKQLGVEQVVKIDTHGGIRSLPSVIVQLLSGFRHCENIIIFPAHNGIRVFAPMCAAFNRLFHRKLHYVVIGGWLNDFLKEHNGVKKALKQFSGIYVETNTMKRALKESGFTNVFVMPNFKDIRILSESELVYPEGEPYRLCTFSRVMKEKGIGEAVEAVKAVNEKFGRTVFTLDIYGQVDAAQIQWFEDLKASFPEYVQYKGSVPPEQSVDVLKDYYALLFPTYYEGEGFAGTLLDAMAAGIPAIVSDWKFNSEIVVANQTGVLVEVRNQDSLIAALGQAMFGSMNKMKATCLEEAKKYSCDKVIKVITEKL